MTDVDHRPAIGKVGEMPTRPETELDGPPELEELHLPPRPDGPGAAAMLAAGLGIFALGVFTVLSEASASMKEFFKAFDFGVGVGPLAGQTTLTVIVWLIVWGTLAALWRGQEVDIKKMFWIGLGFGIAGALFTFPPFFLLFEHG